MSGTGLDEALQIEKGILQTACVTSPGFLQQTTLLLITVELGIAEGCVFCASHLFLTFPGRKYTLATLKMHLTTSVHTIHCSLNSEARRKLYDSYQSMIFQSVF